MVTALLSVATSRQLIEVKMTPFISVHRNLACLHRAVGGVRWRSSYRPAPLLTATPVRGLIDEQISIKGRFLHPHSPVTVCAQMHSEDGDLWEAFAHYNTNVDGTVNLTRDHSVGGSYLGCEPMGLFWGLQPAAGGREGLRLRKDNVETPFVVRMCLLEGHVSPSAGQSTELAAITTERWYMAPGVQRIDVRQNGLVGTLFLPPGPGPFPAMLDLWGIGGGLVEYRSALFASRGYASLSLAYMNHKELPHLQKRITTDDSYFKSAFQLLQDHHQVCGDRVGIISFSLGVYLSLKMVTDTGVKPSCLICINGPVGKILKSIDAAARAIESGRYEGKHWRFDDQGNLILREISLPANFPPESKVKLERLACPVMFIVGEDDQTISSKESSDLIEETLAAAGKSHLFTRLSYPGTGHLFEPPYTPNTRVSLGSNKPNKVFVLWGGHLAPHAAAQEDGWKKILDFMNNHLRLSGS